MSGNARGKLKEHCKGIHNNIDWIVHHCNSAVELIGETHPELKTVFIALALQEKAIDDMLQEFYKTL